MRLLGIANGTPGGNSEILLKAALTAATKIDSSISTSWIHAPSVTIPPNPTPLQGSMDISLGTNKWIEASQTESSRSPIPDDRMAVLNAVLDADAIIIATPVYSHQPAGTLKALVDRIMGPLTDAAFAKRALEAKKAGDPKFASQNIDERLLKPRVVGFVAVAGSSTSDQVTMALPTLQNMVYSLHAKVVDQEIFLGYGSPGSVVSKSKGQAIVRAQKLGENVASQIGKDFDDCQYLGPEPPGACPYCHLSKIDLFCREGNEIGCLVCGAEGVLDIGDDGVIRPVWKENSDLSCITMAGKEKHLDDIVTGGVQEMQELNSDPQFESKVGEWRSVRIPIVPLPSHCNSTSRTVADREEVQF